MLIRYVIRLIRYALFFDPRTMSVGHTSFLRTKWVPNWR